MYKVLIADDEAPARNKMQKMLEAYPDIEIAHVATNGLEAYEQIKQLKPDIVFLDIEMPGMTGIEVVNNFEDPEEVPYIVFVTAYHDYAVHAFDLNAIDYITKPVNADRLQDALDKIRKTPRGKFLSSFKQNLEKVTEELEHSGSFQFSNKLPVPTSDRYKLVDYNDIIYIEIIERFTFIHTSDRVFTVTYTLEHYEKKLPSKDFFRVNRSTIINLSKIQDIIFWFGNRFKILLTNGKEIISSREKSRFLKGILKD